MKSLNAEVIKQEHLIEDIYSMWIKAPGLASDAHGGQFVNLYTDDASKLLPRPISICEVNKEDDALRLVYRTVGEGTKQFSKLSSGDTIRLVGPVGNGYTVFSERPVLLGGGIGIPPMLELAKEFSRRGVSKENISVILGFRNETFLLEEFEKVATVYISSDTGNVGIKGNVIDAAVHFDVKGDALYSCGPKPMLRAVKSYSEKCGVPAYISLEERMACGIGACLACVTCTCDIDDHSKVKNKRICVDGPVFDAQEVEL
ncbi:MAG: dihydroorotate dehydrogenase electron transfer subunit [Eubacterium sp.]|nr:dihydroorotate dehydrogenase electron transfer subunit [Eubacterium sp.]